MCWGIWRKTLRSSLLNQTLWTRHLPLSSIRPQLRFFKGIMLAFWRFLAIQFDGYSEIHGSIIQKSEQLISVWFGRSGYSLKSLDVASLSCFIWFRNRSSTFGSPCLWCSLVTMLCSRFRDGTWRDNKLRHLGGKMGINIGTQLLRFSMFSYENWNELFAL